MTRRPKGAIYIANEVLADLAGYTALESYGVVGMASPTLRDGVVQLLPAQKLRRGVKVVTAEEGVFVDLYVVIEHGTRLAEVSHNLADRVRYVLTALTAVSICSVEVYVMGVKVRNPK